MRLHLKNGDESRTLAIEIDDEGATVRDLIQAVGWADVASVWVDGVEVDPSVPLHGSGVASGAVLSTEPSSGTAAGEFVGVEHGPDSGRIAPLHAPLTVGRDGDCGLVVANPTVSARHVRLTQAGAGSATVEDIDSHNGTWIDGKALHRPERIEVGDLVRIGSSTIALSVPRGDDRPIGVSAQHAGADGTVLFNRPPRPLVSDDLDPVVVPSARPTRQRPLLSVASIIVPVVFATVMVWATGRWFFALFALLSPLMAITNYVTQRRRASRQRIEDDETYEEGLERLRRQLDAAVIQERRRRRDRAPGLLEVRRRAALPSTRLWERRHGAVDAMTAGLGRGDVEWEIPLERGRGELDEAIEAEIEQRRHLTDVPLLVDLRTGPIGIIGESAAAQGLARAVISQLIAGHGPSDLRVAVLASAERVSNWSWLVSSAHATGPTGATTVYAGDGALAFSAALLDSLEGETGLGAAAAPVCSPAWLLVVDDHDLVRGRGSAARELLSRAGQRVYGIVCVTSEDQLPASVANVAQVSPDGTLATWPTATGRTTIATGVADMMAADVAEDVARSMLRFGDPDDAVDGGGLPQSVRPEDLWGAFDDARAIDTRWQDHARTARLLAEIGRSEAGLEAIDLVADGPHGLVAGTTGAGKSEFLRTLVASLARTYSTDELVFVLIDYKGGSAFDRCRDLPHVVGMVTDLDDHLAERALTSLEAELHHRERVLREVQATDIDEYRRLGPTDAPLPRLVVVIDEFATLRAELPEFVAALVGIAQRGRSLGVHLILATQRPSGAVDANIRANTNLRVALRVQDAGDSTDVIDVKNAASIGRETPGRAYVRRGERDLTLVQTAYVSGSPGSLDQSAPIRVAECSVGDGVPPRFAARTETESDQTDLDRLVTAIVDAHGDRLSPRRPWLDDLPTTIEATDVDGLASGDGAPVVLAIGDDPERQRRVTLGWRPDEGHLLVYGVLGSGVTTTLRSLVHRLGAGVEGRPVWVFVADHGAGGLSGVDALAHVGAVLTPTEPERHARLLAMLGEMLDERRQLPGSIVPTLPLVVVVVDGLAGFTEVADVGVGGDASEQFGRIVRDGPAVRIVFAAAANRPQELPRPLAAAGRQHIVHELADSGDLHLLGIRMRSLPAFPSGRALLGSAPTVSQVIDWSTLAVEPFDGLPEPPPVDALTSDIDLRRFEQQADVSDGLVVPIGIDGPTRRAAQLELREGEHALIAGPARSGRTTALRSIAQLARAADPSMVIVGVAPSNDAALFEPFERDDLPPIFDAGGTPEGMAAILERALAESRRWLVVVDDADRFELSDGALFELSRSSRDGVTIVASARSSSLRGNYGHWLRNVRASGIGLLLQPDNGVDGELLAVRLPRGERIAAIPGRGYLVHAGDARIVQVAR